MRDVVKSQSWHILSFSAPVLNVVCQIPLSARFTEKPQTALKTCDFKNQKTDLGKN